MAHKLDSSSKSFKILNTTDFSQYLQQEIPRTRIRYEKIRNYKPKRLNSDQIEKKIVSDHFFEEFLDVGGWKPKNFIEVRDINQPKFEFSYYSAIPIEKFDFKTEPGIEETIQTQDKIIESNENQEKVTESNENNIKTIQAIDTQKELNPALNRMINRMKPPLEDDSLRLAKLRSKNNRVNSMAQRLLSRKKSKLLQ
jgi:hypothetical protein